MDNPNWRIVPKEDLPAIEEKDNTWQKKQVDRIHKRYGGPIANHHGDCLIYRCKFCSCGLLHDLLPLYNAGQIYDRFSEQLGHQEWLLDSLDKSLLDLVKEKMAEAKPAYTHILDKEIETFYINLLKMLPDHEDELVIIHKDKILGFAKNYEDASSIGFTNVGLAGPFLIKEVTRKDPFIKI